MSAYTIRVELRGDPSYEQYEKLHKLMAAVGFARTIQGTNGTFDLPHATYYGQSYIAVSDLRDSLRDKIKATIQNNILVFVAETEAWAMGW